MGHNPRKIAADIIYNVVKGDINLSTSLEKCRAAQSLSDLDMRFTAELCSGTVRNLELLDFYIAESSNLKMNKISPYVLAVLRTGAYQILFMDKVPVSAAVNESVKLIKRSSNAGLSGFVNAVLRSISKKGKEIELPKDEKKALSIEYSCPEWIVKRWTERFGKDARSMLKAMNEKPETILRTNTLKTNADELVKLLLDEGWECSKFKSDLFEHADYLLSASKIVNLEKSAAYKDGLFYVQDAAAAYASEVLSPKPGMTVIDMCASPGGKTTHLAQKMNNTGKIYAFDIYPNKVKKIKENAQRLGIDCISASQCDASVYMPEFCEKADCVLADVPCSGLGIIRRKPDIKYIRRESDIPALAELSLKILNNASRYLKRGGKMVFSTCTTEREENEDVLFKFLEEHGDFKLKTIDCRRENEGYLTLLPFRDKCDGFFISLLEKE